MRERWSRHPRLGIFSGAVAFLFGLAMVWGQKLNDVGELPVKSLVSWCSLAVVFLECWYLLFWFLSNIRDGRKMLPPDAVTEDDGSKKKGLPAPALWLLLVLCWLPAFLAVYPGFFVYDAGEEYMWVAQGLFSTHHPLLHVLLLGKTIRRVYELTGTYNLGIALYTLVQMAVIAACFTYMLCVMKNRGIKKLYRRIVFLYVAFFPNIVMFSLCSTKDTLFAAALLMTVLYHMEWQKRGQISLRDIKFFVPLVCVQTLALLLRNNAVYAFVAGFLILLFLCREKRIQLLTVCGVTLCGYLLCSWGLASMLQAQRGDKQEILTVPIQQISRAYHADSSQLSQEEKELLFSYLPEDALARYTPKLSDPVKVHFNNEQYRADRLSFWKLWLKLFAKNPVGYANAWFMTSYGYWYPDADVDVYRGHTVYTFTYEDSSYFGFETEEPGERSSKLPFLEEYYREISLGNTVQNIPGVSWMFSMGTIFWLYVLCACVLVAKRQYRRLLPFVLPAMVWLTLLLGPTYLPRYVMFLWYLLPLPMIEVLMPCEADDKGGLRRSGAGEDET